MDLKLGRTENNSRCMDVSVPAASAKIDRASFTKNGEVIMFFSSRRILYKNLNVILIKCMVCSHSHKSTIIKMYVQEFYGRKQNICISKMQPTSLHNGSLCIISFLSFL